MEDLRRLLLLRLLVVLGPCAMLLWLRFGLTPPQPLPMLAIALFLGWGALAFVTLHPFARRRKTVTPWELFTYLQLDGLALALLLYFTGGAGNPFVSLLLLPLIIAATLLPLRQVWVMTAITVGLYTGLMFHYRPLPGLLACYSPGFEIHLWGMWLVFAISALLVAGFVARLSAALRNRDRQVAQLREQALRDEQILTLGLFAAGAAHELGTPLSTIAVLAQEMEYDRENDVELRTDLDTLRQQVDACKGILSDLLRSANLAADRERAQSLDALLEDIRVRWQLLRPGVPLAVRCASDSPPPTVTAPRTVSQTLITLLNNAADASPQCVNLEGRWDRDRVMIEIRDQGAGLTPEALRHAGEAFFSTKENGAGIGLLLANAALERLGGRVSLRRDPHGETCTRIDLPAHASPA
ncbi:MAG TPA: ATP-binding protein [Candidatus Competibacteraceae bacterium]|nr:ATP-binding protein [Candidatus Competibacteraceae bacterium]HQA27504.1 ATP-binding protein [Candidatus Competibacteraceae bacterium]HQD55070.1 ATP-binding protein [Candidatus Competibacteraceae bacterium]